MDKPVVSEVDVIKVGEPGTPPLDVKVIGSEAYDLDHLDLKKLGRNALIYGLGAALTYSYDYLMSMDLHGYAIFIVPIVAGGIDALRRYFRNNTVTTIQ